MLLYQVIISRIKRQFKRNKRVFLDLEADTYEEIQLLAKRVKQTPDEVVNALLANELHIMVERNRIYTLWESFTPREKDVAALSILGYSASQIGLKLVVSKWTVRTHQLNVLGKLGVSSLAEMRMMFKDWDFSAWE